MATRERYNQEMERARFLKHKKMTDDHLSKLKADHIGRVEKEIQQLEARLRELNEIRKALC
jgi:hypothetical protein